MDPQPRGPDWMQITPKAGSLFHAYSQAAGRFGKQDFVYIPEEDAYRGHGKRYASYLFLTMNQKRKPRE